MYNFISNMRNSLGSAGVESFIATLLIIIGILVIAEGVFIALSYIKLRALTKGTAAGVTLEKQEKAETPETPLETASVLTGEGESEKVVVLVSDNEQEKKIELTATDNNKAVEEKSVTEPESAAEVTEPASDTAADIPAFGEKTAQEKSAEAAKKPVTEEMPGIAVSEKVSEPDFSKITVTEYESGFTEVPVAEVAESVIASGETKGFVDDNLNFTLDESGNEPDGAEVTAGGFDNINISEEFGKEYGEELEKLFGSSSTEKVEDNFFEKMDITGEETIRETRAKALEEFSDTMHSGAQMSEKIFAGVEEHERQGEEKEGFLFENSAEDVFVPAADLNVSGDSDTGNENADADREAIEKQIRF